MPSTTHAMADLKLKVRPGNSPGLDRLSIESVPLVPEIQLLLAEDAIVWWARMEAEAGAKLVTPFWASAWAGGRALARYILDRPETVAGKRVLDLASGSGLVAIAASMAGAASVVANDIDPYAMAAIELNALENNVSIRTELGDLLGGDGGDAEVVLVGDVLYNTQLAAQVLPFLRRVVARGGEALIGDPGRGHLPDGLEVLKTYDMTGTGSMHDAQIDLVQVLRLNNS